MIYLFISNRRKLVFTVIFIPSKTRDVRARAYSKDAVINTETTVNLSSSTFSDLRHKDT